MHPRGKLLVQNNKAGWSVDNATLEVNYLYKIIKQVGQLLMHTRARLLVQTNKGMTKGIPYLCARIMNDKSVISPATVVFEK